MGAVLDESVLDTADRLTAADRNGLLRMLATAGAQLRESLQLTEESEVDSYLAGVRPRAVLVCCDAAAEVAGQAVAALADWSDSAAPVLLPPSATLPMWAGPADLLLVAGHTGGDERVLAVAQAAGRRGMPLVGVGPAPSPLEEACVRARGRYVPVPPDRPERAALWGHAGPLLRMAGRLGLAPVRDDDLAAAADVLDSISARCRPSSDTFVNPAKTLALAIGTALPVVWGTTPLAGVAAYRLAGQLAGNAAVPAVWGTLPVAARLFGGLFDGGDAVDAEDLFRDRVEEDEPRRPRLVLLRDVAEDPDAHGQLEDTTAALAQRGVPISEITAEEGGPATRLASLIGLIDFVTVYVGLALGVDPSGQRIG
ncbi:MAG: glucose/mannose-6-phosphate isomerase, partial [Mycobacteriales bacterium]